MSDIQDLSNTIIPKSDRLNADDFLSGPKTLKIVSVRRSDDDAIVIGLENSKPYYPCKSMRRVLIACWTLDGRTWIGREITLYTDPEVIFSGVKVGGIRISHLSHIDSDLTLSLTKTRGKKAPFVVRRLTSTVPTETKSAAEPIEQPFYDAEKFEANFQAWADLIASGKKTADQIIAAVQKGGRLTVGQVDRIKAVKLAADDRSDPPAELDEGDPFLGQE